MSIWSRVLVGLIFLMSLVFLYFAAKTLAAHRNWQLAVQSYDLPLEKAEKDRTLLEEGDPNATPPVPSITDLEVKLHDLMTGRGKVWRGCGVKKIDEGTLELTIEVPFPEPNQIQDKMVLYLFEEGEPGNFIGEYKVVGIAEKMVSLLPTTLPATKKLRDQLVQRIKATRPPWSIYETLPTDRHDVFRGYNEAQLSQMMPGVPPDALQEYLRDGSDKQPNDAPERIVNGKYERQLRDYVVYYHEYNRQIASLRDQIAAAKTDEAIAKKLQADAEKAVASRADLIDKTLKPELAEVQGELAVITAHRDALKDKLEGKKDENGNVVEKGVNEQIADTRTENKRLLARWTALQLAAAKRLNELIERDTAGATSYTGE
ncbi:MAG TPA: hypothetical protein VFI31_19370 [Pirellulales bacterium]|nr:hypothetical protein [Pirellulales bacterium]